MADRAAKHQSILLACFFFAQEELKQQQRCVLSKLEAGTKRSWRLEMLRGTSLSAANRTQDELVPLVAWVHSRLCNEQESRVTKQMQFAAWNGPMPPVRTIKDTFKNISHQPHVHLPSLPRGT